MITDENLGKTEKINEINELWRMVGFEPRSVAVCSISSGAFFAALHGRFRSKPPTFGKVLSILRLLPFTAIPARHRKREADPFGCDISAFALDFSFLF